MMVATGRDIDPDSVNPSANVLMINNDLLPLIESAKAAHRRNDRKLLSSLIGVINSTLVDRGYSASEFWLTFNEAQKFYDSLNRKAVCLPSIR